MYVNLTSEMLLTVALPVCVAKFSTTSIFVGEDSQKAPTILKTGESGTIAPTTVYILNDRKTAYVRGENDMVGCGFDFSEISQRSKGIGGMLRGRK